jgi:hypothetical protein
MISLVAFIKLNWILDFFTFGSVQATGGNVGEATGGKEKGAALGAQVGEGVGTETGAALGARVGAGTGTGTGIGIDLIILKVTLSDFPGQPPKFCHG